MNAADFRRIALSLEGAEEGSHMGAPDFRVGRCGGGISRDANQGIERCEVGGREVPGKVRGEGREEVLFEVRCGGRGSTDLNYLRALNAITCTATFCPPLANRRVVSNPQ